MAGSSFGTIFKITTWGESHGKALGVVIDGCPAGLPLCEEDIQPYLNRRKPGQSDITTSRKEGDKVEILSGIWNGLTTGTPISLMVSNTSQRSGDYDAIAGYYRPGHADYTYDAKYGFRDYRGGGRSSGRETVARVAAGAIAIKLLNALGISVTAYTRSIGPIEADLTSFDKNLICHTATAMPDYESDKRAVDYLKEIKSNLDSVGGIMECIVEGMPAGIGEPVFDKLDASLSKAVMSIGAVKAVEIGDGAFVSQQKGSENNDSFYVKNNVLTKKSNHAGGILGGISDGSPILVRAHVKATPSIAKKQETVNTSGENITVEITGRHDPVIVPRAVVVMESMIAITLLDALMVNMSSRYDNFIDFYKK